MSTSDPNPALADMPPAPSRASDRIDTPVLIVAMLESGQGISDLVWPPQVEQHGELVAVAIPVPLLQPDDTSRIVRDLIGSNEQALRTLKEQGACDLS